MDIGARYSLNRPNAKPIVLRAGIRNLFDANFWTVYPGFQLLSPNEGRIYVASATFSF